MMIIYLVFEEIPYNGDEYVAAFSTEEKAQDFINNLRYSSQHFIKEVEVD